MSSLYRVKYALHVLASLDADERKVGFERENMTSIQTVRDDLQIGEAVTRYIAALASDVSLSFGGVTTGSVLYMECDREVTIKINDGATAFKLKPKSGCLARLFWEGEFTQVLVSNASATEAATLTYMIAGA
jgi:hypothetical protein